MKSCYSKKEASNAWIISHIRNQPTPNSVKAVGDDYEVAVPHQSGFGCVLLSLGEALIPWARIFVSKMYQLSHQCVVSWVRRSAQTKHLHIILITYRTKRNLWNIPRTVDRFIFVVVKIPVTWFKCQSMELRARPTLLEESDKWPDHSK